jgi:hypothetical protein
MTVVTLLIRRSLSCSAWVLFLSLLTFAIAPLSPGRAQSQEKPMHHYVMIFRTTRPPTAEEQQARIPAIQHWVAEVTSMGIQLDPRNLGGTIANLSQVDGSIISHTDPTDRSLATLVYFDAPDNAKALEVARIHPGPRWGATLELREWSAPALPTAHP